MTTSEPPSGSSFLHPNAIQDFDEFSYLFDNPDVQRVRTWGVGGHKALYIPFYMDSLFLDLGVN
jgi:hypothetical protein